MLEVVHAARADVDDVPAEPAGAQPVVVVVVPEEAEVLVESADLPDGLGAHDHAEADRHVAREWALPVERLLPSAGGREVEDHASLARDADVGARVENGD